MIVLQGKISSVFFCKSFFYTTSVNWNSLSSHILDINLSQRVFKKRLKKYFLEIN